MEQRLCSALEKRSSITARLLVTDKYTLREKYDRLKELCPENRLDDQNCKSWLEWVEEVGEEKMHKAMTKYKDTPMYFRLGQTSWDVHTGKAFTKLYRAMK